MLLKFFFFLLSTHLRARGGVHNVAFLELLGGLELRAAEVTEVILEDAVVEEDEELVLELHL